MRSICAGVISIALPSLQHAPSLFAFSRRLRSVIATPRPARQAAHSAGVLPVSRISDPVGSRAVIAMPVSCDAQLLRHVRVRCRRGERLWIWVMGQAVFGRFIR